MTQQFNDWRKASYSSGSGNCVEVGRGDASIGVRDTKDREGGTLAFSPEDWKAFLGLIK